MKCGAIVKEKRFHPENLGIICSVFNFYKKCHSLKITNLYLVFLDIDWKHT